MLRCDKFGPKASKGIAADPDEFPVGWHPHIGMDICTYIRSGGMHIFILKYTSVSNNGTCCVYFKWADMQIRLAIVRLSPRRVCNGIK